MVFANILASSQNQLLAQESVKAPHVEVSLVAPKVFGRGSETIGIRFKLEADWHIYWINPGDSGAAPKFQFSSTNAVIGKVQWPIPKRLPVAHLTNIGFDDEVVFPLSVTPVEPFENLKMVAKLEWLVCKVDCVPGFANLVLTRQVSDATVRWSAADKELIDRFVSRVPNSSNLAQWSVGSTQVDGSLLRVPLVSARPEESDAKSLNVYPYDPQFLTSASPMIERTNSGFDFLFQINPAASIPKSTEFLLVQGEQARDVLSAVVGSHAKGETFSEILILLAAAFLGGLILNFMPCVLPVLSIKILSLASATGRQKRESLLYSAGVIVSFTLLGAVFLLLRFLGQIIGWGFHLQSPVVVYFLVILFWLMALNFLGVFDFGTRLMNTAGNSKWTGSFGTGVLSVFVAAPCTGPFMGSALGATATLPVVWALGIFVFLGLGLSSPFLLLCIRPEILKWLPRPGAWMESFKELLAFPLFATVLWLLWVAALQVGSSAWLWACSVMLAVAFSFWLGRRSTKLVPVAWLIAICAFLWGAYQFKNSSPLTAQVSKDAEWTAYRKELLVEARQRSQGVFVDFTAAWCITCQVNKKVVLERGDVLDLFRKHNVLLLRADWTHQNPEITQALADFDRNSVPLYVYYAADGSAPRVLPQILAWSTIEELFTVDP